MKRNLDLIRDILLFIEDSESDFICSEDISFPEIIYDDICDHLELMMNVGFISYDDASVFEMKKYVNIKMLYKGHDYLDAIKDKTVWNKTKEKIKKISSSITFDLIKDTAKDIIKLLLLG